MQNVHVLFWPFSGSMYQCFVEIFWKHSIVYEIDIESDVLNNEILFMNTIQVYPRAWWFFAKIEIAEFLSLHEWSISYDM